MKLQNGQRNSFVNDIKHKRMNEKRAKQRRGSLKQTVVQEEQQRKKITC